MTVTPNPHGHEPELSALRRAHGEVLDDLAELTRIAESARPARLSDQDLDSRLHALLRTIRRQHKWEDEWLWPRLRTAASDGAPALDELEVDHDRLDLLTGELADTRRPLCWRIPILRELHALLETHFDRTYRDVPPLVRLYIPVDEWQVASRSVLARQHDKQ